MPDYCQLDEAFGSIIEGPVKPSSQSKRDRKKEKEKKEKSVPAVPQEEPFEIGTDPDRQQYVRPKLIEAMKKTKPSWFGTTDNVEPSSPLIKNTGATVTTGFADFNPVDNSPKQFMLGSDFMSAFNQSGAQKASAFPAILNDESDIWGPLVPPSAHAQAPTSYYNFDHMRSGPATDDDAKAINKGALQRRLQSIYERLDALETAKRENAHTEVMLFVLSGVFLLFSLDIVTKISK